MEVMLLKMCEHTWAAGSLEIVKSHLALAKEGREESHLIVCR